MTATRSRRGTADAALPREDRSDGPVDSAIIALAELLGEQLAAEEIARRSKQPPSAAVDRDSGGRRSATEHRPDHLSP